jgi:hypothetical protein
MPTIACLTHRLNRDQRGPAERLPRRRGLLILAPDNPGLSRAVSRQERAIQRVSSALFDRVAVRKWFSRGIAIPPSSMYPASRSLLLAINRFRIASGSAWNALALGDDSTNPVMKSLASG